MPQFCFGSGRIIFVWFVCFEVPIFQSDLMKSASVPPQVLIRFEVCAEKYSPEKVCSICKNGFNHRDHHNLCLFDPSRRQRNEENVKGKQQQFLFHFLPRAPPDENITRSVIGSFHFLPSCGWDLPYCHPPSSTPAVMREYFPRVWKQIQALLFRSLLNQPNQLSLFSFSRVTIHSIRLLKVSVRWISPSFLQLQSPVNRWELCGLQRFEVGATSCRLSTTDSCSRWVILRNNETTCLLPSR